MSGFESVVLEKMGVLCERHKLNVPHNINQVSVPLLESLFWHICSGIIVDQPKFPGSPVKLVQSMLDFISEEILSGEKLDFIHAKSIFTHDVTHLEYFVTLLTRLDDCINQSQSTSSSLSISSTSVPKMSHRRAVLYSPKTTFRKHRSRMPEIQTQNPKSMIRQAVLNSARKKRNQKLKLARNAEYSDLEKAVISARNCSPIIKARHSKIVRETVHRIMNSPGLQKLLSPKPDKLKRAAERRHELLAVKQAKLVLNNTKITKVKIRHDIANKLEQECVNKLKKNQEKSNRDLKLQSEARQILRDANLKAQAELTRKLFEKRPMKPLTVLDRIKMLQKDQY